MQAYGETCLIKACIFDRLVVVKLLLQKGALPNLKDRYGWTALDRAVQRGYEDVAACVYSQGGNCNMKSYNP